jgi:hypothetical protein
MDFDEAAPVLEAVGLADAAREAISRDELAAELGLLRTDRPRA